MRFGAAMASAGLDRGLVALRERLVAFGVGAHPSLRRGAGERTAHLGRRAEREGALGDLGLGCYERARGDHRARADARAVEHLRAVADQALFPEPRRVDRAVGADRRAGADLGPATRRDVHDGAVLDVGAAAYDDRIEVAAEHGVVPHGRALLDRHVSDDHGGGRNERGRMDSRALALEAEQWHGLDPPSMLGGPTSYSHTPRQEEGMPFPQIAASAPTSSVFMSVTPAAPPRWSRSSKRRTTSRRFPGAGRWSSRSRSAPRPISWPTGSRARWPTRSSPTAPARSR